MKMKPGVFLGVGAFGILLFSFYSFRAQATTSFSIVLSEISTAGTAVNDEFVELYNPSDAPLSLAGWQLRRRTESGSENSLKVFGKDAMIPAHGYYLWANSHGLYASPLADAETTNSLSDDNSLALFNATGSEGTLVDSVNWGNGAPFTTDDPHFTNLAKKSALIRDTTTLHWSTTDWLTPTNSHGKTWAPSAPPAPDSVPPDVQSRPPIRFNEIYANPVGEESVEEFIELYNPSNNQADLSDCRIRDSSKSGVYIFPAGTLVAGNSYLVLKRGVSKISLNNSTETLSLFDISGAMIETITYNKTKEGISYNYTGHDWRGGIPTPGSENDINSLPETNEKVPKKGYHGFSVSFDARGNDADNDTLKYVWDFGDGHKSYKKVTTHRYSENGSYQVTLTTSDGQDDITETFPIEITTFPKPDVRITKLTPNPSGNDSTKEFLIIENRGKKAIDLKDFSIATGWKKLVNHPIREKFILLPGTSKKITRDVLLFTLPNQKGKIELRLPDGSVLQTIKYKLPKSAAENTSYQKEKGKRWQWQGEPQTKPSSPAETVIPIEKAETPGLPDATHEALPAQDEEAPLPTLDTTEDKQVLGAETIVDENALFPPSEVQATSTFPFASFKTFLQTINSFFNHWQNEHSRL